ncbi:MAG: hypothetical protein A2X61_13530 [Ignavibacteria bacterium GWB2_35_12]|nr:MAG: hypothetical protein A2X63_02980 [Ignavibacteria bacterium GWA2_35_8]OGU39878.1 MAG: hypothetical protein A2X61_13530 [Ignavibacteria bacterium GWB2_35_12]OGU86660.1 MAG: hypothetical protein A2220_14005 [Ignavibacteria bacterium RIFOXYA2_FULL_35_10]OGV21623.1 MAG: hypothetical protein A2475_13935 [Ignavibacteria bacterium RIFOXYC2_FULL_35_21]
MAEDNKIIRTETGIEKENNEEILMNQLLLKEIKDKIRNKIDKNDPSFIKTLKYMLHEEGTKNKQE